MSERNTLLRTLHDVGLAAWFGGSLMGAVGLNSAAGVVDDPRQRARVATAGWAAWAPVNAVAIGAHLVGAAGLLFSNRDRVARQAGVGANSVVKTVLTGAALAVTAWSGVAGGKMARAGDVPVESGAKPESRTPADVAEAQRRLRALQWAIPATTGALLATSALQGEQQKPTEQVRGYLRDVTHRLAG